MIVLVVFLASSRPIAPKTARVAMSRDTTADGASIHLLELPDSVLTHILSFSHAARDLIHFSESCKLMRQSLTDDCWKRHSSSRATSRRAPSWALSVFCIDKRPPTQSSPSAIIGNSSPLIRHADKHSHTSLTLLLLLFLPCDAS